MKFCINSLFVLLALVVSLNGQPSLFPPPPPSPTPGTNAPPSYQLLDLDFNGYTTRTDKWLGLYFFNYTQSDYGWGGSAMVGVPWDYSMRPNFPSESSSAVFYKGAMDGRIPNGYPAMEGIYTLFTRTPFIVYEDSPLAGLKSISFQLYSTTGGSDDLDIYGQDGDLYKLPVLTLNTTGGEVSLSDYHHTELYKSVGYSFDHSGGGVEETFDIYENYRLYQWDLSFITDTILSFWIEFETFEHVSFRSIQLDQSLMIVPEPAAVTGMLSLLTLGIIIARRRKH